MTFIRTGLNFTLLQNTDPMVSFSPSQNCDAKVRVKSEAILLWQLFSANMTGLKLLLTLTPLTNKKGDLWHFYREKKGGQTIQIASSLCICFKESGRRKDFQTILFFLIWEIYFICLSSKLTRPIKKNKWSKLLLCLFCLCSSSSWILF